MLEQLNNPELMQNLKKEIPVITAHIRSVYAELDKKFHLNGAKYAHYMQYNYQIPKEIIEKIVEAGTYAASGMNRQPGIIVAVTNKELRDKLSKMNSSPKKEKCYWNLLELLVIMKESATVY